MLKRVWGHPGRSGSGPQVSAGCNEKVFFCHTKANPLLRNVALPIPLSPYGAQMRGSVLVSASSSALLKQLRTSGSAADTGVLFGSKPLGPVRLEFGEGLTCRSCSLCAKVSQPQAIAPANNVQQQFFWARATRPNHFWETHATTQQCSIRAGKYARTTFDRCTI
jgi:hypothetical protein